MATNPALSVCIYCIYRYIIITYHNIIHYTSLCGGESEVNMYNWPPRFRAEMGGMGGTTGAAHVMEPRTERILL